MAASSAGDHLRRKAPAGPGALPACQARAAALGVRQPCCRSSRAHDPARGATLILLVTGMLWVIVTFVESVRSE